MNRMTCPLLVGHDRATGALRGYTRRVRLQGIEMDRGDAYAVLAAELAERRQAGFAALVAEVGGPARQKFGRIGEEEVVVDTLVEWADSRRDSVRIVATAAGPSCWRVERLEESVVVNCDG